MGTLGRDYAADTAGARGVEETAQPFLYEKSEWPTLNRQPLERFDLPEALSCCGGLTHGQKQGFGLILCSLGIAGLLTPNSLLVGLSALFWTGFASLILWRAGLLALGLRLSLKARSPRAETSDHFPVYTIMVAAYREAAVMKQLARSFRKIDWPADKLDIMILLEEDDEETLPAALEARFPKGTRVITVPDGQPRTKPRALNYGLMRAKGDFVCIYDAEDRPHPRQLKEAYSAFSTADERLACVQAPLIGANSDQSILAAHWSLEYAVQFRFLLPALSALCAPIPIGGTSNHFKKTHLIAAGGWDAFNVTEDADLGLRFSRMCWRVGTIEKGTLEDAPTRFSIWKAQRSRWIKGFIQSWLVLMRRPSAVARQMGWWNFAYMQLSLGGAILAPIAHGPLFLILVASLLTDQLSPGSAGWALLFTGWLVTLVGDLAAPGLPLSARLKAALTRPLYWPLHSLAAWTALCEMISRPHYWAKTPHEPCAKDQAECCIGSSPSPS